MNLIESLTVNQIDWLTWTGIVVLCVIPACLISRFVWYCWPRRKNNILDSFDEDGARCYLKTYHPSEWKDAGSTGKEQSGNGESPTETVRSAEKKNGNGDTESTGKEKSGNGESPAVTVRSAEKKNGNGDPESTGKEKNGNGEPQVEADARTGKTNENEEVSKPDVNVQHSTGHAKQLLDDYYASHFPKGEFAWGLVFLLPTLAIVLLPCRAAIAAKLSDGTGTPPTMLWDWVISLWQRPAPTWHVPTVVILAVFGGYMRMLYDLIHKSFADQFLPRDLYWFAFRLVICIPTGFALAEVPESGFSQALAFCLGAVPTGPLMHLFRRTVTWALARTSPAPEDLYESELQKLSSVDAQKAEVFLDEGLTSIHELANSDPVRLAIRTGLPFGYIIGVIGDALLWMYLDNKENFAHFRLAGINGAYDCCLMKDYLWIRKKRSKYHKEAVKVVKCLAGRMNLSEESVMNIIFNVANDRTTKFLDAVWQWDVKD